MAELILSAVGFALAAPGTALAFKQCGESLQRRIDSFKNAPEIVLEIGRFGHDLYQGQLRLDVELAEWAFAAEDVSPVLKDSVEGHLEKLRSGLQAADRLLKKLSDRDGEIRRTYFVFTGERNARDVVRDLREWQNGFSGLISLIDMKRRVVPDNLLLSRSKFKARIGPDGREDCTPLEPGSHIHLATGELLDGVVRDVSVLIERKRPGNSMDISELKAIASFLAYRLAAKSSDRGVLRCLGFRESPDLELVFEIPSGFGRPKTLRNVIAADLGKGYGGCRPIDHRFRLARAISEAVLSVHTAQLVHKNIRPEAILVFLPEPGESTDPLNDTTGLGTPFLSDWSMLRKASGLSSRRGGNDWMKDIYRHPKRQGLQPEERYNMGHDIYSLGVCLLEIGLWEPLIRKEEGSFRMCDLFRETAVGLQCVKLEDSRSTAKLTQPLVVQKVMVGLAKAEIPQRMGIAFARLIISCLTCLEGGMGDPKDFEGNAAVVGVKFNDAVLQSFTNISF